jgi:hypothetical protein
MPLVRLRGWLSGLWAGVLLAIALVAAPTLFALLERAQAGRVASRLFAIEAAVSLLASIVIVVIERGIPPARGESQFSVNLRLALGALFCTVAGYYALQPMVEAARAGQGKLSFATLHAISSVLYAAKAMLVLVLAWRTAAR